MGRYFKEAGPEDYAILAELIEQYRDDLREAGARIKLLLAFSDSEARPALAHKGHAVAGQVRVNSLQDRVEGKADATITLDGESWALRSEQRKRALVHHELSHLGWERGKLDDLGRPRLHLKPADWLTDGFDEVVRIYGDDAQERRNLISIEQRLRQESLRMG